jgi:hypothetical protein
MKVLLLLENLIYLHEFLNHEKTSNELRKNQELISVNIIKSTVILYELPFSMLNIK